MTLSERLKVVQQAVGATTTAFRWFDSAAFTVDYFGGVAVLSVYDASSDAELGRISDELMHSGATSVYLKRRPKEARHAANIAAEALAPALPLRGQAVDEVLVQESGSTFEIRPANGLSVGLYLDARDARQWVATHAQGKTVANFFAYTCGFGVAALRGGATRAVNVDLSRKVLDWGARNTAHNGFEGHKRDFIAGDSFDWLARFAKKGERFDVVVLDPPGFASSEGRRFTAARDYHSLVALAAQVVTPGGRLLAMCNVEALSSTAFEAQLKQGLGARSHRLEARFSSSAVDFELRSLKCVVVAID